MCLLSAYIRFLVLRYGLHFFGCWTLPLQSMGTRTALEDIVTCPYRKRFFISRMTWNFDEKNAFFLWKFWKIRQFSKKYNCGLKRSKDFIGMKYDEYGSSLTFYIVFQTLTWLQYIRYKIFSSQIFVKIVFFLLWENFVPGVFQSCERLKYNIKR